MINLPRRHTKSSVQQDIMIMAVTNLFCPPFQAARALVVFLHEVIDWIHIAVVVEACMIARHKAVLQLGWSSLPWRPLIWLHTHISKLRMWYSSGT